MEIYKVIHDYPNYEVSTLGNVRNIGSGRVLRPIKTKNGYLQVNLCKDGKHFMRYVHRLIASVFIPNPDNKPCVNHIDGDKHNNRVENLEWCSHSENMKHAFKTGLAKVTENNIFKTNNPNPNPSQPCRCMETNQIFESQHHAARYLGCTVTQIWHSIHKGWGCKGFHFELI